LELVNYSAMMDGLSLILMPQVMLSIFCGLVLGVAFGAMPGVKGSTAIAIMLPFVYYFDPIISIMFLSSVFTGSNFGGGILAILLGMPGNSGAIATVFDGYPMTQNGRQNEALGIGLVSSAVGALVSWLIILFAIQSIGKIVLLFGPGEMLMLTLFAISIIGMIKGEISKALLTGIIGLLLGTVGASAYGAPRGTFGSIMLIDGLPLAPVTIGVLAIAMIIELVGKDTIITDQENAQSEFSDIIKGMLYPLKDKVNVFISTIIGVVIGLLPAAGSSIAATLSYGVAQSHSKKRKNFGNGEPSGLVSAETANSSSEAGSMATMMAFGIPGSGVTAMLMAAFMMAGYVPGPYLVREDMDVAYAVVWGNIVSSILLVIVGIIFIRYFCKVIYIPTQILVSGITVLAVIGAFGVRSLYMDVIVLCIFALFGYLLKLADYPALPVVLGFILGDLVDAQFARTVALYSDRYEILLQRPLFVGLLIFNILIFTSPLIRWGINKIRRPKIADS